MRIGVDATCWANPRGYGRFTRELLPRMLAQAPGDRFVCFLDRRSADVFDLDAPNVERVIVRQSSAPTEAASADGNRSPVDMLRLTRAVSRSKLDVFFSPSVYTFFPLPPTVPAVVTVHDAIADRYPSLTLPSRRAWLFWRLKVGLALLQSRLILTVSDYAATDIERTLDVARSRLRVALEAPAPVYRDPANGDEIAAARARLAIPADIPWFVYVGGFNPHKNVDVLIAAHGMVAARRGESAPHLVLVGPGERDVFHVNPGAVSSALAAAGTRQLVRMPGFLPDRELRGVYAGASAVVLPSVAEGFGLPAVEGAACGTPVIATRESPLPRLLEGGGVFITPGSVDELVAALERLCDRQARAMLGARARERALALTWDATAEAVMRTLREAA